MVRRGKGIGTDGSNGESGELGGGGKKYGERQIKLRAIWWIVQYPYRIEVL